MVQHTARARAHPRRSGILAAGIAASAAILLAITGCSSGGADPQPDGDSGLVALQTVAVQNAFDPIDPHVTGNGATINLGWYVFEALYQAGIAAPTEFHPALAAGEPEKVDDTTYVVKIREGATFHDGSPVTGDDVAFSFNRVLDMGADSFLQKYLVMFDSIEATGDDEVTFSLTAPTALFMERASTIKIIPRASVEGPDSEAALSYSPIGSGPYSVESADPDVGAKLVRYKDYNGPLVDNLVAETIDFQVITDANARIAALQSGEVDAIAAPPTTAIAELESSGEFKVEAPPSLSSHLFFMNSAKAPFDDPLVRQAVLYAMDRDAIAEVAYDGYAVVADLLVPETNSDYSTPSTVYTHDVDKAKDLLAQAGYPDGLTFEFQVPTENSSMSAAGQLIQAQLAEAGITAEIRPGDTGGLYERVLDGSYQAMYAGTSPALLGSADAEFLYRWLYYGSFVEDYAYWSGPDKEHVEDLLDEAVAAPTREEYQQKMDEVYAVTSEVGPIQAMVHPAQVVAWNVKTSAGVVPSPVGGIYVAKDV